ncbi:transporter substrate-binding domain-containing protein [Zooshikella marina]|uniref:substrate-binding periplasmic protein n=1 Tax=Zooshikella ganghwensis TaxID=202772 RepID=UPI001BB0D1B0|nr:transporter substrate-binding domain-containing protein [Zooshikella ganghwensis]MBU2706849.1 transporter substrate-binding domain-containing protein [Zooshikella ganghwensis]
MKLILLLGLCSLVLTAKAGDKVVKIATLNDYEPFCFSQKFAVEVIQPGKNSKNLKGYSWDIVRESYHHMGYTIELYILPWSRALDFVKTGKVELLFPTGKNNSRKKIFRYSTEYINKANLLIYTLQEKALNWNGIQSLKGMTIAVKKDYNYGDTFNESNYFKKINVKKISQGFKVLLVNRVDGFAGYEKNWDYIIAKENIKGDFKKSPYFGYATEFVVGKKESSSVKQLLNIFDQGKRHIDKIGLTEKIRQQWFQK